MVAETKGTRMNTKALAIAASLWVPMVASAATEASVTDRQEALSAQLEQILSKNGITIGGSFRGEVGSSVMGGNYTGAKRLDYVEGGSFDRYSPRDDEQIGYTSVDFDLRARPNTATTARAVFRMHLDHANFFGSPYVPIQTRWLSLDGGFADMAYYHLGNLQMKWSPLVIGATEPGFLYTPRIFAQQQKQAMDERFIGGGVRNLQGVNLGVRAAVPNLQIDSFDVSLLAAKLLSTGPVGGVASTNVSKYSLSGDKLTGSPDSTANFDRWALGAKGSVTFLKGITLGGNFLQTKDLKSTFGTVDEGKLFRTRYTRVDSITANIVRSSRAVDSVFFKPNTPAVMNPTSVQRDSALQNGGVIAANIGANVANILGNKELIAELNVNVARSAWDYMVAREYQVVGSRNDSSGAALVQNKRYYGTTDTLLVKPVYETKAGMAINLDLAAGWKASAWAVKVKAGYLMNDSLYRSDLAQAPVFYSALGRIFNTEQDVYLRTEDDDNGNAVFRYFGPKHYNTFDALYHNVHRYVAEDKNEYAKSPYDKLAYSNYVGGGSNTRLGLWTAATKRAYAAVKASQDSMNFGSDSATRADARVDLVSDKAVLYMVALDGFAWDRDLQLALPGGEASANRVGPKFGLDFDLMQGGLEIKVDGYLLQEAKGTILDSVKQLVAEKAKFQQIQAGARVRADRFISGWSQPIELSGSVGLSSAKGGASLDYTSTAINAGLYVGVIKRLAVLGGYQLIDGKDKLFLVDRKQSNMAGGLEFKVQEGAYLLGMYNLVKTEFPNAPEYNFDQTIWSTKISVSF